MAEDTGTPKNTHPIKIYPTIEECKIKNKVNCPIMGCNQVFYCESNLNMHLTKTHQSGNLKKSTLEKWFFCPNLGCVWNQSKHFPNMKGLRQHYLKVHTKKCFKCESCQKSFASEAILTDHKEFCTIDFNCLDCNATYGCYFTLRTHARRKNHKILRRQDYKPLNLSLKDQNAKSNQTGEKILFEVLSCEKPTQTTRQTQTGCRNIVIAAETQTEKPILANCDDNVRDMSTQTDIVESKETSCNTSFDIKEFEATFTEHIEKSSFGTQTRHQKDEVFVENQTDTSDLLSDSFSTFDTNFFNCNTETQTDLIFDNEILLSDYYSNMHTQTCDEILGDLNDAKWFSDIQTQTGLRDTVRSVESQTLMSTSDRLCPNILKDIVHSETQTDAEFRQMLEIINS